MVTNIIILICGYLLGSIPFALVIGKLFYHTDVRQYGSGNLGGTNAGRVLGKKVGAAVILLDGLKVVLAMGIASIFSNEAIAIWTGLVCVIGHCWPIFAKFKGGKGVASTYGFLLASSIFIFHSATNFLIPLAMFFIILYIFKFVSLASITAVITSSLFITGTSSIMNVESCLIIIASWCLTLLVINRHAGNIEKIKKGTENTVSWL